MSTTSTTDLVNALTQSTKNPAEVEGNPSTTTPNAPVPNGITLCPQKIFHIDLSLTYLFLGAPPSPVPDGPSSTSSTANSTPCSVDPNSSNLQPISLPVMNSLVATNKVVIDQAVVQPDQTAPGSLGGSQSELPTVTSVEQDKPSVESPQTPLANIPANIPPTATIAAVVAAASAAIETATASNPPATIGNILRTLICIGVKKS